MSALRRLSALAVAAGAGLLVYGAWQGQVSVHLVVVVPVVTGTGPAAALGGLLLVGGVLGWVAGSLRVERPPGPSRPGRARDPGAGAEEPEGEGAAARGGGVILLGPIPIAWGSDRESLTWVLVLAVVLILAALGLTLVLGGTVP